jgi:hypothetical protein
MDTLEGTSSPTSPIKYMGLPREISFLFIILLSTEHQNLNFRSSILHFKRTKSCFIRSAHHSNFYQSIIGPGPVCPTTAYQNGNQVQNYFRQPARRTKRIRFLHSATGCEWGSKLTKCVFLSNQQQVMMKLRLITNSFTNIWVGATLPNQGNITITTTADFYAC